MSRSAPLAWTAALAAAAYPTWECWRIPLEVFSGKLHYGGHVEGFVACREPPHSFSPSAPSRDALATLAEVATTWAVPVLVVLAALVGRTSASRAAWALVVIAAARPLAADYRDDDICSRLPMFTADWFESFSGGWGLYESCLLGAALLVLTAQPFRRAVVRGRRR
ncbi:hypothetical protein [Nonomuraea salmonea]|uniref:DoxX family membrane protein n=1 Tax=Nonomuraea salmonea TaxID=46181 RepID=A0ABV5NH49_9ACTN